MQEHLSLLRRLRPPRAARRLLAIVASVSLAAAQIGPALATIDNTATASGTYNASPVTTATPSSVSVPVQPALPSLSVAKTAAAPVDVNADGVIASGDTITYTYVVTNTGNVTITAAKPVDTGPKFNTVSGTGTLGAFSPASATLAPGASQTFTAVYTLSNADAFRAAGINPATGNAVENTATATGTPASGTLAAVTPSSVEIAIPANPKLQIVKTWAFQAAGGDADGDGKADVGDKVVYTYTVSNTGNVATTAVKISDTHEGTLLAAGVVANESLVSDGPLAPGTTSSDASNNGTWDTLQPGAVVKFTYTHTVTQAEVDAG